MNKTQPTLPPTETVSEVVKQYVSNGWQPKDWNELFAKVDELFLKPIKENKSRYMHITQVKILELAKEQPLKKMTLRQIGALIGVNHPQIVDHHLRMLIKNRFINKNREVL